MKTNPWPARWAGLLLMIGLVLGLTACTDANNEAAACDTPQAVTFVVGAHANTPAPVLQPQAECVARNVMNAGGQVLVVSAEGIPVSVDVPLEPLSGTDTERNDVMDNNVVMINAVISSITPTSPQLDTLEAIAVAADLSRAHSVPHALIWVLDSGLSSTGVLDFAHTPGLLGAAPSEITAQLAQASELPNLDGMSVTLSLGYTTGPQPDLGDANRTRLYDIYTDVLTASGANVTLAPFPVHGAAVSTDQPVDITDIPAPTPKKITEPVDVAFTEQNSQVRFVANTAEYLYKDAAISDLTPVAQYLKADGSRHAAMVATTARVGDKDGQITLSNKRCQTVTNTLVDLGAAPEQISCEGLGSYSTYYQPDDNNPAAKAANRAIHVTLT